MNDEILNLCEEWRAYKLAERHSVEARRQCEDRIAELYRLNPQAEGTVNYEHGEYKVKIVSKITRSVDSDLLQEIAAEHGYTAKLSTLFKWKADINSKFWGAETDEVKKTLSAAITSKPSRPTFTIDKKEK